MGKYPRPSYPSSPQPSPKGSAQPNSAPPLPPMQLMSNRGSIPKKQADRPESSGSLRPPSLPLCSIPRSFQGDAVKQVEGDDGESSPRPFIPPSTALLYGMSVDQGRLAEKTKECGQMKSAIIPHVLTSRTSASTIRNSLRRSSIEMSKNLGERYRRVFDLTASQTMASEDHSPSSSVDTNKSIKRSQKIVPPAPPLPPLFKLGPPASALPPLLKLGSSVPPISPLLKSTPHCIRSRIGQATNDQSQRQQPISSIAPLNPTNVRGHENMMEQIRQGIRLKPTLPSKDEVKRGVAPKNKLSSPCDGLAEALTQAIKERRKDILAAKLDAKSTDGSDIEWEDKRADRRRL